jgi:hypothetical protein
MKQIIIISTALLFLAIGGVQAQNGIDQVLKNIETNNKELQANEQLITSQKLEAKTDNNLPDPTLSYAHLWGAKDKSETIGELVVSQSFDFPSLYATRNKLNRLKAGTLDSQSDVFRQEKHQKMPNYPKATCCSLLFRPKPKDEKESLNTRFDRERKQWEGKIGSMAARMNDIGILTTVLTEALSERQIALEYTHTLMALLTNLNAQLRKKRKERFLYYTTSYDQRLDKDPRNMFIDVDLEKQVKIQETFSNHL